MLKDVINKLFGTTDEKIIKKMKKTVNQINELESSIEALSDEQLSNKTFEFKEMLNNGKTLDDILPEAFAVVREVSKRKLGLRPYDVQLIGGIILHRGMIAEMKTGEGKTLMSAMPIYLNALTGNGVHIVTVNEYLAKRDRDQLSLIYDFLHVSSGVIYNNMDNNERKRAYEADITYGTNSEFGFDYLRDNMVGAISQKVQRGHNYAIVDEIDSILIDEARTPLIISGAAQGVTENYNILSQVVRRLTRSYKTEEIKDKKNTIIPDDWWGDYEVDEKARTVTITDKGISEVEKILNLDNLFSPQNVELTHFLNQALKAKELFKKDKDYIINENGEVIIIDEFTGRPMEGRRYSDGLHQAIEAKEGLEVAGENQTLATITLQNYFKMYKKLSGMTGTAKTEEDEFKQIYNLKVVVVPTNKPVIREDYKDIIYQTKRAKKKAIINKISELYEKGQPVLVGTASIEYSEEIAAALRKKGIPCDVLNAKYHQREAEIVSQAGRFKTVTIATNMAGRGTDIKLGGDPEALAKKGFEYGTPEYYNALREYEAECLENREKVLNAGGLFILGTERHESRRIDNQLRGRSGRQGDPGASQFYLAMEDDLMRLFGGDRMKSMMNLLKLDEDEEISSKSITKIVENSQKRVESRNFAIRKSLIEFDDVNNTQREFIYNQRNYVLNNEELRETILDMLYDVSHELVLEFDQIDDLNAKLQELYLYTIPKENENLSKEDLAKSIYEDLEKIYLNKKEVLRDFNFDNIERYLTLEVLDQKWRENLKDLSELREGINLQSFGQKNPVNEYRIQGAELYNEMIDNIKRDTTSLIMRVQLKTPEEANQNLVHEKVTIASNEDKNRRARRKNK